MIIENLDLNSGYKIPIIGLGTWRATDETELENALNFALELGYRHIDTASLYRNEHIIGKVLKEWLSSGKLKREDLFITSKLPPWGTKSINKYLDRTLTDLQLEYLDLYLIHLPFSIEEDPEGFRPAFVNGIPIYDNETDYLEVWKVLEQAVAKGKIRSIGISNFNRQQIERIIENCKIPPSNHQLEHHIYLQQPNLIKFCKSNKITVTAYAPLGSPGFSDIGKEVPNFLQNPVVNEIALKHKKTAAQVLINHIIQKGMIVIPKSVNPKRIRENLESISFKLEEEDMSALNDLDYGLRLFDCKAHMKNVEQQKHYPFER